MCTKLASDEKAWNTDNLLFIDLFLEVHCFFSAIHFAALQNIYLLIQNEFCDAQRERERESSTEGVALTRKMWT